MKITDVRPISTSVSGFSAGERRTWTFVQIDTDEGITGLGEATNDPGGAGALVGPVLELVREALIGMSPFDSERIWQTLYRRFTYLGSRGLITVTISGIEIALSQKTLNSWLGCRG